MECVDFSTCRVDSEQAVRILNNVCGFSASRADFRQVVRIVCDPEPTGNRPFRAKKRRFRAYTAGNPPDESAQVLKNPHDRLRIRTTGPESTNIVQNQHDLPKIRMTWRESTRPAENPHDSSPNATNHGRPLYSLRITQKIRSMTDLPRPNRKIRTYLPVGAGCGRGPYRHTNPESLEFRHSRVG